MNAIATLNDCLVDLRRALAETRWCLIGAQAAILYGSSRMTQDVDVSLMLAPQHWPQLLTTLTASGFVSRIDAPLEFAARSRVLLMQHLASRIPLDIVLAGPGLEELFLDRARFIDALDQSLPVIAPEDLIASKLLAGRPHDIDDVTAVIRRCPELDAERVVETLTLFEQALDRSDLLPMFRQLIERRRGF